MEKSYWVSVEGTREIRVLGLSAKIYHHHFSALYLLNFLLTQIHLT